MFRKFAREFVVGTDVENDVVLESENKEIENDAVIPFE